MLKCDGKTYAYSIIYDIYIVLKKKKIQLCVTIFFYNTLRCNEIGISNEQ